MRNSPTAETRQPRVRIGLVGAKVMVEPAGSCCRAAVDFVCREEFD